MSPSGLAKRAGLDPTAFNKSKRFSADGRPRWPSTESLSKILEATGSDPQHFFGFLAKDTGSKPKFRGSVPLIGMAKAGGGGFFDDAGYPTGQGWDQIEVPGGVSNMAFALQVQGDSMLPLYQDGEILVIDPEADVRRGDRIVARTTQGEVMAKILQKRTAESVELLSLNPEHPLITIATAEIGWISRVTWASQ